MQHHARRAPLWLIVPLVLCACIAGSPAGSNPTLAESLTMNIFEPLTLDPARNTTAGEDYLDLMVFEPLLSYDAHTMKPIPAAAQDLPNLSADGRRYTLTLRQGLVYSDGSPVLARDFAYGWSRVCDPVVGSRFSPLAFVIIGCEAWNQLDPVKVDPSKLKAARDRFFSEGVVPLSDRVLEFNLTRSAPYFPSILAMWLGAPVRESDVARGGEDWTEPATFVGNGPFVLSEWKRGEHMVFTANPRHRIPPKVKRWTMITGADRSQALSSYRSGRADVHILDPLRGEAAADPTLKDQLVVHGNNCFGAVRFNVARAPLDDPNLRLALAKSFDRAAFVRDVMHVGMPALSIIPPGMPGYDPADDAQAFDPVVARELFASSRYGTTTNPAPIEFAVPSQGAFVGFMQTFAGWFRDQWRSNLGLEIVLKPEDQATSDESKKTLKTRALLSYLEYCPSNADQNGYLSRLAESKSNGPIARWGYTSMAFDELIHAADSTSEVDRRERFYTQASRLLSHDAPLAFIWYPVTAYLRKPWVRGITDSPLDTYPGMFDLTSIYATSHN
ncbi:MAG: peptide ABC transporter substrate-binding protein [Chloroflexi bacterium]|nr:MAG: peptide ABC transporter substrate-binding protein [Chloroflexota bacterium]